MIYDVQQPDDWRKHVLVAKDTDGNEVYLALIGPSQDTLKVWNEENIGLLNKILKELTKLNMYISNLSDNELENDDIEV